MAGGVLLGWQLDVEQDCDNSECIISHVESILVEHERPLRVQANAEWTVCPNNLMVPQEKTEHGLVFKFLLPATHLA